MTRADVTRAKVYYKTPSGEDLLVMVDSAEDYQKWIADKSVPLAQVVSSFQVFTTHRQGPQGRMEMASNAVLENELGTSNEDAAVMKVLQEGTLQEFQFAERQGRRNDSNGEFGGGR